MLNRKTLRVNNPEDAEAKMFPTINLTFAKHWVVKLRWVTNLWMQIFSYVGFATLFLAVLIPIYLVPQSQPAKLGCVFTPTILIAIQTAILVIVTIFLAVILNRVNDSYYIKVELQAMTIFGLPLLTLACVLFFIPADLPFWLRGEYVVVVFTVFSFFCSVFAPALGSFRHVVDFLAEPRQGTSLSLHHNGKGDFFFYCLQDERLFRSFEAFCVESFAVENLFFYRHAVQYRNLRGEFMKTEAYRMRYEYITEESVFEVALSPKVRDKILRRIEEKNIDDTLYAEAEQEVYLTMRQSIYPLWKRSDMYKELIRTAGSRQSRSLGARQFHVSPLDMDLVDAEKVCLPRSPILPVFYFP